MGMKNGLILEGPLAPSFKDCSKKVWIPPIPVPTHTPQRVASIFSKSSLASSIASLAAATANWVTRSIRLPSFLSPYLPKSKSFTSPAILTLKSVVSNWVIIPIPDLPAVRLAQNSSLPVPIGVIGPTPVTTTLLLVKMFTSKLNICNFFFNSSKDFFYR